MDCPAPSSFGSAWFLQGRETALARLQVSLCFETPQIFDVLDTLSVQYEVQLAFPPFCLPKLKLLVLDQSQTTVDCH